MGDVATNWKGSYGDWQVAGPSLANDDGLQTAVLISLFTHRRAEPDDVLPNSALGRRGWWGDAFPVVEGDLIGSRLWLLWREKRLDSALRRAEEYAREALRWLVEDGVARSVNVTAEALQPTPGQAVLALQLVVVRSAQPLARFRFELFWKGD